jgi:hypothetical protein
MKYGYVEIRRTVYVAVVVFDGVFGFFEILLQLIEIYF